MRLSKSVLMQAAIYLAAFTLVLLLQIFISKYSLDEVPIITIIHPILTFIIGVKARMLAIDAEVKYG